MKHYLLTYHFVDDYAERRTAFRGVHLELAWAAQARGDLVLAGALNDPMDTGLLLFIGEAPEAAEVFARNDPYVTNGLVKNWTVRQWVTVVGDGAATPIRP